MIKLLDMNSTTSSKKLTADKEANRGRGDHGHYSTDAVEHA